MKKLILYVVGMNILALGIIFNTLSLLGVGAFSTLPYALSLITQLSFGQANIVFYLIFVLIQIILEKQITVKLLFEIPFSFVFGILVDFYQFFLPTLTLTLPMQILILLVGNTFCGLGVFLMIKGDIVLTPVDGLVYSISKVFKHPYSICKNGFDITMILITCLVCLVSHNPIYGIGVGTLFSAFYIGRVICLLESKEKHILN